MTKAPDSLPEEAVEAAIRAAHRVLYGDVVEEVLTRGGDKDLTKCVRAAILAFQRASWRPIEEAPRDGRDLLLWGACRDAHGLYTDDANVGFWHDGEWHTRVPGQYCNARAWQPLPAPPPPTDKGEK